MQAHVNNRIHVYFTSLLVFQVFSSFFNYKLDTKAEFIISNEEKTLLQTRTASMLIIKETYRATNFHYHAISCEVIENRLNEIHVLFHFIY